MTIEIKHTYRVRKQISGYSGNVTWIVVRNPGGQRVSTWPHRTRVTAQVAADELNELFSTTTTS